MLTTTDAHAAFNEAGRRLDQAHHEYHDGEYEKAHRLLSDAGWLIHQIQQNVYTHLDKGGAHTAIVAGRR